MKQSGVRVLLLLRMKGAKVAKGSRLSSAAGFTGRVLETVMRKKEADGQQSGVWWSGILFCC
jgi:hypothetical protein